MNNDLHIGRSPSSIDRNNPIERNYGRRQYYHEVDTLTAQKTVNDVAKYLEKAIQKLSNESGKASQVGDASKYKEINKVMAEFAKIQDDLADATKGSIKDFDKLTKVYTSVVKNTNKYALNLTEVDKKTKEIVDVIGDATDRVKDLSQYMGDTLPKSISSWMSKTADSLQRFLTSTAVTQMAFGGKSATSLRDAKVSTMWNYGMSSSSFESFKNQLLQQNRYINDNLGNISLNMGDVADYLTTMSSVSVANTSYLQQNYKQLVLSNKYLKVQSSTIQDIARTVDLTGKNDILNSQLNAISALKLSTGSNIDTNTIMSQSTNIIADTAAGFNLSARDQAALTAALGLASTKGNTSLYTMLHDLSEGSTAFMTKYANLYNSTGMGDYLQGVMTTKNIDVPEFIRNYLLALQKNYQNSSATGDPLYALRNVFGLQQDEVNLAASLGRGQESVDAWMQTIEDALSDSDAFKKLAESSGDGKTALERIEDKISSFLQLDWSTFVYLNSAAAMMQLTSGAINGFRNIKTLLSGKGVSFGTGDITASSIKNFMGFGSGGSKFMGLTGAKASMLKFGAGVAGLGWMAGDALSNYAQNGNVGQAALAAVTGNGSGVGGALANTAKGALVGAMFGPVGALIGGGIGLVANLIKQSNDTEKEIAQNTKNTSDYLDEESYWAKRGFQLSEDSYYKSGKLYTSGGGEGGSSDSTSSYPWRISSPFGKRTAIVDGKKVPGKTQMHHGVDFATKSGTPFGAAESGTVKSNGYSKSAGNYVSILGDNGWYYRYYHQVKKSPLMIGSHISAGDLVGYVGSTGNSTGPHLHFQVDRGGNASAVNPLPYVTTGIFYPGSAVSSYAPSTTETDGVSGTMAGLLRMNASNLFNYNQTNTSGGAGEGSSVTSSDIDRVIDTLIGLYQSSNDQRDFMRALAQKNSFRRA